MRIILILMAGLFWVIGELFRRGFLITEDLFLLLG
jgi:hypothetical protein